MLKREESDENKNGGGRENTEKSRNLLECKKEMGGRRRERTSKIVDEGKRGMRKRRYEFGRRK